MSHVHPQKMNKSLTRLRCDLVLSRRRPKDYDKHVRCLQGGDGCSI